MGTNMKRCSFFLVVLQVCFSLTPSHAILNFLNEGRGGGIGGDDVTEILAAGLITKMLMEDFFHIQNAAPLVQSLRHNFATSYHHPAPLQARPVYPHQQMVAPRVPLAMRAQYVYPVVQRPPVHMIDQITMQHHIRQQALASARQQALASAHQQALASARQQALASARQQALASAHHQALASARQQALASAWRGQYTDMRGGYLNAYMPMRQEPEPFSFIENLLTSEALSTATLLLNSDFLEDDEEEEAVEMREEVPDVAPEAQERQSDSVSETIEAAASESESRYILPRIVRHFVQRIMRRVEQH